MGCNVVVWVGGCKPPFRTVKYKSWQEGKLCIQYTSETEIKACQSYNSFQFKINHNLNQHMLNIKGTKQSADIVNVSVENDLMCQTQTATENKMQCYNVWYGSNKGAGDRYRKM